MISLHGSIICASDGAKGTESTMAINTIIVIFTIVCISKDDIQIKRVEESLFLFT